MNEKYGIEFNKAPKGITTLGIVIVLENVELGSLWNMVFLKRREDTMYLILQLSTITAM